ncbi:MAG: rhodanese-related sulfurtransferase [Spirochaetota bacterium]
MSRLYNIYNKEELMQRLHAEPFQRKTISFYRYCKIFSPQDFRDSLFLAWDKWQVLGRIYVANEGINAQMSIPEGNYEAFLQGLQEVPELCDMPIKVAVEDDGKSFHKLVIKVRKKIVQDGIDDPNFDPSQVGKHISAEEFNQYMEEPDTVVVDMRNSYESEVGHFENAVLPEAKTFREELPEVLQLLQGQEDKKILLYCTGGIRCEKASAYLKYHGYQDVNQLYGGIIHYAHEVNRKHIPSKFIGKNFVFDNRLGERISEEVISRCHTCGTPCDRHINCVNDSCHKLFLQCEACSEKYDSCCQVECQEELHFTKVKTQSL